MSDSPITIADRVSTEGAASAPEQPGSFSGLTTVAIARPALVAAGLWWLLAGGDAASWLIGAPAVAAASWASWRLRISGAARLSPMRLAAFAPFFVWESLRGGVDVALRVVGPSLRVRPGFVAHRLRLPEGPARVSFANCVSLLPGSLAADLEGDELIVHLLDVGTDAGLARLEAAVARVYGVALEPRGD